MAKLPDNSPQPKRTTGSNAPKLVLSEANFQRICQLIYQRAGIVLAPHKREMVYNRLMRRLRLLGMHDFSHYLALLQSQPASGEWQEFINALTTNLTSFFREAHHFPILAEHAAARQGSYSAWSCAASTGEEPYSIALTLAETLGMAPGKFHVYATDIDTQVLGKAQQGIYRQEALDMLSPEKLQRYFLKGKSTRQGQVCIRPELAGMVRFEQLNLLSPDWKLPEKFDAIFCRNIMIYFDKETQARILRQMERALKPGGLLFAGHSENFSQITRAFWLRGKTVYSLAKEK